MFIINNISALKKQVIKKNEDTFFLSFSQRVFLSFYQGFTGSEKEEEERQIDILSKA